MKHTYLYTLSVAAMLLATACTDDLGVQDLPVESGKGQELRAGATLSPSSRMTIENDGKEIHYYWTADDSFTVFDAQHNQQTTFTVDASTLQSNSTKADFVGTPTTAYTNLQKVYAVYNRKNTVELDENGNVNFDLSNQNGQLNEDFQYMWGDATYKEGKPLEFVFRHLVTTLQVKIAVPEGVETLTNVTLYAENLVSQATLVLKEAPYDTEKQFGVGDLVYPYNDYDEQEFGKVTLDGTFAVEDGYVTLYIYTLSAKQYDEGTTQYTQAVRPFILFTDQTGLQHVAADPFDFKEMHVGAVYSMNITQTLPLVDFNNEDDALGEVYDPYQIANEAQLYSFMMRSHLNMQNSDGWHYNNCSYQLTSDLVLDTRSVWYPVIMDNVVFDGNGKTLSGNLDVYLRVDDQGNAHSSGLFGQVSHCTIKDLTLDVDMTLKYNQNIDLMNNIGTLVGDIYQSTLQRCFSSSRLTFDNTINTSHASVGGLVGNAGHSTIEYCGFSGEITSGQGFAFTGGILGRNGYGTNENVMTINGCYNNGSITAGKECKAYGGIVGQFADFYMTITNCWSNSSFTVQEYEEFPAWCIGGIAATYGMKEAELQISNNYWKNTIKTWCGEETDYEPENCSSFEGNVPSSTQLEKLNYAILSSGLMFSKENGHLVKNNQTGVPPSDIENW